MCSGQRWVGQGRADTHQIGWTKGWEPVAIKIVRNEGFRGLTAKQEVAAMQKVQQASKQLPGRCNVIHLPDSYAHTDERLVHPGGTSSPGNLLWCSDVLFIQC